MWGMRGIPHRETTAEVFLILWGIMRSDNTRHSLTAHIEVKVTTQSWLSRSQQPQVPLTMKIVLIPKQTLATLKLSAQVRSEHTGLALALHDELGVNFFFSLSKFSIRVKGTNGCSEKN